jgi:two-component system sensor histidine kinase FlrB
MTPVSTPEDLQQAFQLFNQVSEQLTGAYMDLQKQVEQLTQELAVANGELRRQLQEKESLSQRLSLLLATLPGGVVVLDDAGRIAEANPAAFKLLSGSLLGEEWQVVSLRELAQTTVPGEWQAVVSGRRIAVSSSQIGAQQGEILLLQDVTEAYQLQDQLQRHQRLSSMGEMVAGLAHQLRTPLAAALLYTSHLRGELEPADRVRFADKALARLHSLEKLIKDMLIFVRGGKMVQEDVSVAALLADVQHVMEPQMNQHGLHFSVDDRSSGAYLLGSREALAGALLNLLANAMQACQQGGKVALSVERDGADWLLFLVSDSGKGMPLSVQERLFEPFFTTRTEGTGLGLAIVREVAQMHGGEVAVSSTEGVGSEFRVRLPVSGT